MNHVDIHVYHNVVIHVYHNVDIHHISLCRHDYCIIFICIIEDPTNAFGITLVSSDNLHHIALTFC